MKALKYFRCLPSFPLSYLLVSVLCPKGFKHFHTRTLWCLLGWQQPTLADVGQMPDYYLKSLFIKQVCGCCVLADPWLWPRESCHHGAKTVHNITHVWQLDSMWLHLYCQNCFTLLCQPLIAWSAFTPHDINTISVHWIKMSDLRLWCDAREHMCLKER